MLAASETVVFAIQAGVRLYGQARQAYIEETRARPMVIPLPGLDAPGTGEVARNFFSLIEQGQTAVANDDDLSALHDKAVADLAAFERDEPAAFRDYVATFEYIATEGNGERTNGRFAEEILALNLIPQWRRGDEPHPSAFRRIAGTLVEIGVDYFATGPGKISGDSADKEFLRKLLGALDDHSFVDRGMERVIEKLFVAGLEALSEQPGLLTESAEQRELIVAVAGGLAKDVHARLAGLAPDESLFAGEQLGRTASLVLRSVARHAGTTVLAKPGEFLGVEGAGEQALVTRIGTVLLDSVLPGDGSTPSLSDILSLETLDGVVKAGLAVVAEHPDLLEADAEFGALIKEVAAPLAASKATIGPDLLAESVRLVLERSAANLHLFWSPDPNEPEHLLATAAKTLLTSIATAPAGASGWRPRLTRDMTLDVLAAVLDEVAEQPGLVTGSLDADSPLKVAIETVLTELAAADLKTLTTDAIRQIVQAAVLAVAQRSDLLDRFDGSAKTALGHVLEAVFAEINGLDAGAKWTLARSSTISAVTTAVLAELAEHGITFDDVKKIREAVQAAAVAINNHRTFSVETFAGNLARNLAA